MIAILGCEAGNRKGCKCRTHKAGLKTNQKHIGTQEETHKTGVNRHWGFIYTEDKETSWELDIAETRWDNDTKGKRNRCHKRKIYTKRKHWIQGKHGAHRLHSNT